MLVVSLPTRGRPQKLLENVKRNMACLSRPDTILMVHTDKDDVLLTPDVIRDVLAIDPRVKVTVKEREDTLAAKWNRALRLEINATVYTCIADDDPLVVKDTDEKILKAAEIFPDGIGMVFGDMANASFSGLISFTKKMVDLLGYIQPEHFPVWFCDHWTTDIGKITGRIVFADVRTDQSAIGENKYLRELKWWSYWFDAAYLVRRAEAYKVIDALDEPQWRKDLQRSIAPQVEAWSRFVNGDVRNRAHLFEMAAYPPDDRYWRVKKKAIAEVPAILETLPSKQAARIFGELLVPPNTVPNLL